MYGNAGYRTDRFGAESWREQMLMPFEPYDAKGPDEQSSLGYTFRSEPPPILVIKNRPVGRFFI